MKEFQVRQMVVSVKGNWMVTLEKYPIERLAREEFDRLRQENQKGYFELVCLESSETCIAYTKENVNP